MLQIEESYLHTIDKHNPFSTRCMRISLILMCMSIVLGCTGILLYKQADWQQNYDWRYIVVSYIGFFALLVLLVMFHPFYKLVLNINDDVPDAQPLVQDQP